VEQISFLSITVNGSPALLLARTFAADAPLPIDLRGAPPEPIKDGLANGETILADGLATYLGARVGDTVALDTPCGPRKLRVAGVVSEYAAGGWALYLDWKAASSLFGHSGVHVFLVTLTVGGSAEAEVERYCAARGLFLQRSREFRKTVDDLTRGLTAGLWALLAVMIAVAGLGVANTVAVVAKEQRADVRIMYAIGMSARRIRWSFRLQTVFLTLAGVPGGALCGIGLAFVMGRTIRGLWGYGVQFEIQWEFLLWSVGNAILVAILTGFAFPLLSPGEPA
jgi:ABC-type lipoprotein release transport system permease subunit